MKFTNFILLNTSWSVKKSLKFIKDGNFDTLFLNLPQKFELFIRKNQLPYDPVYEQDFVALSPLIEFCKNSGIEIYCYKDDKNAEFESSCIYEILRLVLRSKIREIEVEEWKKVLKKQIIKSKEYSEYEAMKLIEKAGDMNACINMSTEIENFLKAEGFEVNRIELYDFSRPIDKLLQLIKMELEGIEVDNSEYERAIGEYISFIDAVVEMGYEEACKYFLSTFSRR